MNLLFYGLAAVAIMAVVVLIAGFTLPETRSGTHTLEIAAPPRIVRDVILDIESQPRWRDGIAGVQRTGQGWTEITTRGEKIEFRLEAATDAEIRMSFVSSYGYHGQWTGRLNPLEDGGTQLAVTETATTPSPFGRVLSILFFNPEAFARAYLESLEREAIARISGE